MQAATSGKLSPLGKVIVRMDTLKKKKRHRLLYMETETTCVLMSIT